MRQSQRQKIAETLREEIAAGQYASHEPLPGEYALCERFGVSRATLRLALDDLVQRGMIYRRQGSGTYVNPVRSVMQRPLALLLREPQKAATVGNLPLIAGASSYLESLGTHLVLLSSSPLQWSAELKQSLAGVIVVPPRLEAAEVEHLRRVGLPAIAVSESDFALPSLRYGFRAAVAEQVQTLLDLGHRRFALLSGHDTHGDRVRKEGIAAALAAGGVDRAGVPDMRTNYDPAAAWAGAQQLLELRPRPTAVLAFDDTLALQMIRAAREQGVAIPEELSVAGFGDAPHAVLVSPMISTVHIPVAEGGRRAAEALCRAHLHGEPVPSIELGHEVCWRESTGQAPRP